MVLGLDKLEKLVLSKNQINVLNINTFNGMFSKVDLYLSDNKIEKFEGNPFNCLETLKSLWLKNNQIILDSNGRLMSRNDFKKNGFVNKSVELEDWRYNVIIENS